MLIQLRLRWNLVRFQNDLCGLYLLLRLLVYPVFILESLAIRQVWGLMEVCPLKVCRLLLATFCLGFCLYATFAADDADTVASFFLVLCGICHHLDHLV